MRLHRIAQFINTGNGGIRSSVKTDTIVGTADVIINRTGDADDVNTVFRQGAGSTEGTITTNGNDTV